MLMKKELILISQQTLYERFNRAEGGGPCGSEFCVQIFFIEPHWIEGLRSQIFLKSVLEIWSFLDLDLKIWPKLVWLKKISICPQNFISFKDNYLACQNYLVDEFLAILCSYRVRHQTQTQEIRPDNKVQVLSNGF